jgi:phospholipid/cholesterol/gamma-HCH transport system ATP-binding protein
MIGDGFPERKPIIDAQPQQTRAADDGRAIDSRTADADESSKLPAHRSATDPEANSATVPASSSTRESPLRRFTTLVSDLASHALDRAFGPGTASNLWDSLNHDPTQIHAQLADPNAAYEIEFENVYKSFESRPVLKGLNLRIRRGEAVGIMGRSGCGKSTTLRLIAGFELPDAGSVRIRGWTRDEPIQYELGPIKIGMVFQHAALFDSLTVFENVAFELEHNTDLTDVEIEQAVDVILTRLGLGDTRELLPSQLSGGMRKRVSLARSLVSDLGKGSKPLPDLLLYDEPTAGLDPIASTRIENLIREVRETVPTCIVVSHQLSTIQRTVDRVVLLHGGRIRWDGPVTELEQTRNPFVRQLLSGDEKGPMSGPEFDPDSTLYTPDDLDEALE